MLFKTTVCNDSGTLASSELYVPSALLSNFAPSKIQAKYCSSVSLEPLPINGRVIDSRPSQSLNAPLPMDVTLLETTYDANDSHSLNAYAPIAVALFGKTTYSMCLKPAKA